MNNSKIEWTDHTFNPWWGCMKVSAGCVNCYAEILDNRYHHDNPHWGPGSSRKEQSDNYWKQPLKWNAVAEKTGISAKVFCASMGDVFEGHPDTLQYLTRLFKLIEQTPFLIWQLLTKRPENIMTLVNAGTNWGKSWPKNVWIGTSVENQKAADERIPFLLQVPAKVRFLSCEPLLGPVDITQRKINYSVPTRYTYDGKGIEWTDPGNTFIGIQWVIVGGESGRNARPMHPDWVRSLRDQCQTAGVGVSFFFKQWGEYIPVREYVEGTVYQNDLPVMMEDNPTEFKRLGKKGSGRLLDGIEWNEFPNINKP